MKNNNNNNKKKTVKEQTEDFAELLEKINSVDEKKRSLWLQIYKNAVEDREMAHVAFTDLYKNVHNYPDKHAVHAQNLSKYLERVSKANDQLLKLAELVANEEIKEIEEELGDNDIFQKISTEKVQ